MRKLLTGCLIFPNVYADNGQSLIVSTQFSYAGRNRFGSLVVEAHSIYKALILWQPEEPRLWVSWLR